MSALVAQWRILRALMVRDLLMRYGRENLGFVWVVIEPMILCTGVAALWSIMKPSHEHGIQVVMLVVTGYMPLTLFRHLTGPQVHILRRNLPLLVHRQLSLIDFVVARGVLELAATTLATCVVYGALALMGLAEPVQDMGMVIYGWLLLALFSFSCGAILAAITEVSESAAHFVAPIQYLSIPLAPTFYMVDWLPTSVQALIYYNPMAHPYEMIRAGVFGAKVNAIYHPEVTLIFSVLYLAIGLAGIEAVKEKLHEH